MSDIKDRLKFNSGTDTVTKSVADAVTEVLNSGQAPQTRMEKQAALHNYSLPANMKVFLGIGTMKSLSKPLFPTTF